MPRRAASPTPSDGEVDIAGHLFDVSDNGSDAGQDVGGIDFDMDGILNGHEEGQEDEDGDEAFIALKQAASFRKSSNIKGKSVKRGGGFQAMGKSLDTTRPWFLLLEILTFWVSQV